MANRPKRVVSAETRAKLSAAMQGKRNAAKPHNMSQAGIEAIRKAQARRRRRERAAAKAET